MTYLPDSAVKWIVVHYSATIIDTEYTFERLERDHLARGFRAAGYHRYITRDRPGRPCRVIEGRDLSQPGRFETGAHSKGENSQSVGICFEGGLIRSDPHTGRNTMTPAQEAALIGQIEEMLGRFPKAKVTGHRDMPGAATQCPGFDVSTWWRNVRRRSERPPWWNWRRWFR